jgi:hypothetical protein
MIERDYGIQAPVVSNLGYAIGANRIGNHRVLFRTRVLHRAGLYHLFLALCCLHSIVFDICQLLLHYTLFSTYVNNYRYLSTTIKVFLIDSTKKVSISTVD